MTSSYLDYRDKSIRNNDGRLILVFKLMIQQGRRLYADKPDVIGALDKWDYETLVSPPGCFAVELNKYWETEEGRQVMLTLLEEADSSLSKFGEIVPAAYLNEVVGFGDSMRFLDIPKNSIQGDIALVSELVRAP